jgi:hypothetical protein
MTREPRSSSDYLWSRQVAALALIGVVVVMAAPPMTATTSISPLASSGGSFQRCQA